MTTNDSNDPAVEARAAVVGLKITGVFFLHDFIEVHMGDVILTGMTQPFGMIGCQGVGPASVVSLIGHRVDDLTIVAGEYVAIDSGENRLAFPIGGPTATGPESVLLVQPAQHQLGIEQAMWVW
jgi:hypothetical protein